MLSVLRSEAQWKEALRQVLALGLPPHRALHKNWAELAALLTVLEHVPRDRVILDAGAEKYSAILPWLAAHGYNRLIGINLTFGAPQWAGPIMLEYGDVTRTKYPDGTFAAITCLSVIEHGVDVDAYLAECARLLEPGGWLITSTDYWPEPIDTGGRLAYGVPVHVFTRLELEALLEQARAVGLEPMSPIEPAAFEAGDRVVHWRRVDLRFTHCLFVLRKL